VKYKTNAEMMQFMSRAIDEVRAVPGVQSAALVRSMPQTGNFGLATYTIPGAPVPADGAIPTCEQNVVGDGFFQTMRIPLTAGRDFNEFDREKSAQVAIVNDEFARREWPGQPALGKQVTLVGPPDVVVTVVGVVGSVKQQTLGDRPAPQLYQPMAQAVGTFTSFAVRTTDDASALAPALRRAVQRIDASQPVWAIRSMDSYMNQHVAAPRFTLILTAAFALLAMLLATVGVYGVMSYVLVQRTRELGIRMALGARTQQVVAMVVARGARTIVLATVAGLAGAYGAAHWLQSQLFEVKANDPLTFVVVPIVLAAVALVACYLPARRAARVDPVIALRQE
jgi:putative ABC transport system permease protein